MGILVFLFTGFALTCTCIRADGKSQVRKCLGFFTADYLSSLVYESAEQKPKHCPTWDFLSALTCIFETYLHHLRETPPHMWPKILNFKANFGLVAEPMTKSRWALKKTWTNSCRLLADGGTAKPEGGDGHHGCRRRNNHVRTRVIGIFPGKYSQEPERWWW